MIAANNSIRIYQIGQQAPADSYGFGHPDGSREQDSFFFMDVSNGCRTVVFAAADGIGGPLELNPTEWTRELCQIIGHREFTPEEPTSTPRQQVC